MKVVLVEDSRLARTEMRRLLASAPDIEIVGEAENADEAETLLASTQPDLIFLDIDLPGRNGFELLASLDAAPRVVFCTAYSEYAVKAFEQNALDYLVKPVEPSRLSRALDKARQSLGLDNALKAKRPNTLGPQDRVFVRDGERCWFVTLKDVRLFEVDGNYTRLYFGAERPLIPKGLNYLESRLDPQFFFRISRRHIVNLQWISSVTPAVSGGLQLTLKGGEEVEVSRRQAHLFREALSL
jgi:two-component system, LytTR family, response regulator